MAANLGLFSDPSPPPPISGHVPSSRRRPSHDRISFAPDSSHSASSPSALGVPARHGSRAESERLAASQRDLPDEDARLVVVGDAPGTAEAAARWASASAPRAMPCALASTRCSPSSPATCSSSSTASPTSTSSSSPSSTSSPARRLRPRRLPPPPLLRPPRHRPQGRLRGPPPPPLRSLREQPHRPRPLPLPSNAEFLPTLWKDLRVGDVVRVVANETLPADIALLSTSDPTGVAYVQTMNLDGESNLKTRYAKQETLSWAADPAESPASSGVLHIPYGGDRVPDHDPDLALYISMELVRLGQAYFMIRDTNLYDENSNSRFQCRALNINEDLGQIKQERSFSGRYGSQSIRVRDEIWVPKISVRTDPELVRLLRNEGETKEGKNTRDFFLALAACNTIVPIVIETSDPSRRLIDYQGDSPDEQALVYAAAAYGFVLVERTSGHIVIDVLGNRQRFDVLGLHEFDSDRKRMSVIIGCPDKTVKLFVKKDFEEWQLAYERASTALLGRGGLLKAVAASIETNLEILGASGIEDRLQQGVPEAIESLRQAGIKVWVLTGDKQETAISIGYSCRLLTGEMTQIVINSYSRESCRKSLEEAIAMCSKLRTISPSAPNDRVALALIIDGNSLVYILETDLEEELFKVATMCDVVLCCRVAPLQKAGIVALIKNRTDDMTLAIGDGANDVSMIQMADVGIGISGQEGRQAVMASDFAMGQFRFLVPLLLVHGHWNYQRMAYMILYNFYRNAVFVFVLFWYVLYTAFTLTTAITEWSSVLYSVIYTAVPTIVVGILDKDLSRRTLLKYPQLYGSGQREEKYNLKLFILIMMDTVWQSLAIYFIPFLAYRHSEIDGSSLGDLWLLAVVILVNIHLALDVIRWNWITHASIWGSIVATVICVMVIDSLVILPGFWAIYHVLGTAHFGYAYSPSS
uniref:Phospholipid-transporting ATPase n=1 Tax=Ananas comosus var. bracteatus TaxID=296719 RepID=A0A6V7PQH4_ANACO|nr:unnamed protein product [Ananas comosus var. bracteatus]